MIRNQWYAILDSKDVKPGKPIGVTRMGEKLVVWRDSQNQVCCMADRCPHRGAALSLGTIQDNHITCPFHGFEFDSSGACQYIPANGRNAAVPKAMRGRAYPAKDRHGLIWMYWGETPSEELPPIRFFDVLDSSYTYSTIQDHWPAHYSRAIENQLDVVHLPFVHRTTIGRGNRKVVDGPWTEWDCEFDETCNLLNVWLHNRVEDGTRARREKDMPRPDKHPQLQFIFPNVWHNWISDDVHVFAAFAPIDDENTQMIVRFYQRFMKLPVLSHIVNAISAPFNRIVLDQDKHVVATQIPKRSDLRIGERLIPGDLPIITYRKKRRELIDASAQEIDETIAEKERGADDLRSPA